MPVDSLHPCVIEACPAWELVRDTIGGAEKVKCAGERYLPKLDSQSPKRYEAYKKRAVFFNATRRTHEALNGLLFRKPPTQNLPSNLGDVEKDADLHGNSFIDYSKQVVAEVCGVGRCGTLVDWSDKYKRPYLVLYTAENIVNWRISFVKGKGVLSMLVLKESYDATGGDEYAPNWQPRWRVLKIEDPEATTPVVKLELYIRNDKGDLVQDTNVPPMLRNQKPLTEIPFAFHNADGNGPNIGRVPLYDLAHVNVSHYQNSADLENGRHLTGNPTPYIFGMTPPSSDSGEPVAPKEIFLGSDTCLTSTNPEAKAGFLEFTGQGLGALENAMKEKESQMAALGARLIEPPKKDAEAYETVELRATAEASTLARIGIFCTASLVTALAWCRYWLEAVESVAVAADGIDFALNKDFVSSAITPEMLTALTAARSQGQISATAFFYQLQRGEMFPDGWTQDDEEGELEEKPPIAPPIAVDPNVIDPETGKPRPKPVDPNRPPAAPPAKKKTAARRPAA